VRFDGFLFDLDGTLADTLPICFAAFRRALMPFSGRSYSDEEIASRFGPTEEGMIRRLVPDHWEACLEAYLSAYEEESRRRARLFPGIDAALRLLQARGVEMAIVTGKGARSAGISLGDLQLAKFFAIVETGSPDGGVKPGSIRKVLTRWGVPPQRAAYVGDAPSDIEAARAAGVMPLAAAWAPTSQAEALCALTPRETFRTVDEFVRWIEKNVEPRTG